MVEFSLCYAVAYGWYGKVILEDKTVFKGMYRKTPDDALTDCKDYVDGKGIICAT